jgi:hypothetical protein
MCAGKSGNHEPLIHPPVEPLGLLVAYVPSHLHWDQPSGRERGWLGLLGMTEDGMRQAAAAKQIS